MAGTDRKDYHCTQPCGDKECPLKVERGEKLEAIEGSLVVFEVDRSYQRLPYGMQPLVRHWDVRAKNGGANSEQIRFHCTKVLHDATRNERVAHNTRPKHRSLEELFWPR